MTDRTSATSPEERAAAALVGKLVHQRDEARHASLDACGERDRLASRLLAAEEITRTLRADLHAAHAAESGLCLERDGLRTQVRMLCTERDETRAALADERAEGTRRGGLLMRVTSERDGLRECLLAALAFVELHTGNGCRVQPPDWARFPSSSNLDAERVSQVGRATLATIEPEETEGAARATVLHIADRAAKRAKQKDRETFTRI